MYKVYCSHHNLYGVCTIEDYHDAQLLHSPSGMVRVIFDDFTQAVPFHTLKLVFDTKDEDYDDMEGEREFMRIESKHRDLTEDEQIIYGL